MINNHIHVQNQNNEKHFAPLLRPIYCSAKRLAAEAEIRLKLQQSSQRTLVRWIELYPWSKFNTALDT